MFHSYPDLKLTSLKFATTMLLKLFFDLFSFFFFCGLKKLLANATANGTTSLVRGDVSYHYHCPDLGSSLDRLPGWSLPSYDRARTVAVRRQRPSPPCPSCP
jgi:hypothetical protein